MKLFQYSHPGFYVGAYGVVFAESELAAKELIVKEWLEFYGKHAVIKTEQVELKRIIKSQENVVIEFTNGDY